MILTYSGTDGVGKSTQGELIMRTLEESGIDYRTVYVRGGMTPLCNFYKKLLRGRAVKGFRLKFAAWLAKIELIFNWCVRLKFIDRRDRVVICDRYIIDTEVDFIERFGEDFCRGALWKFLLSHAPVADLSLLYTAPVATVGERLMAKGEFMEAEKIKERLSLYSSRASRFDAVIDSSEDINSVWEKTKAAVMPLISRRKDARHLRLARKYITDLMGDRATRVGFLPINAGLSGAHNYAVFVGGQRKYFLKLYALPSSAQKLKRAVSDNDFLVFPIFEKSIGLRSVMTLSKWIDGTEPEKTAANARLLADELMRLHSIKVPKWLAAKNVRVQLWSHLLYIYVHRIDFPHRRELTEYLKKNLHLSRLGERAILHMDFHLKNIIRTAEGKFRIIDLDNVGVSDPLREFVYAACFHPEEEDEFWREFLLVFFPNGATESERERLVFYTTLHAFRMIVSSYKNMPDEAYRIAESVYERFHR